MSCFLTISGPGFARRLFAAVLFFVLLTGNSLYSRAENTLPGAVDPGRLPTLPETGARQPLKKPAPALSSPVPGPSFLIEGADQITLTLHTVKWDGAPPPDWDIDSLLFFKDMTNQPVSFQAVLDTLAVYQTRHREKGYIFSEILLPEQDLSAGTLILRYIPAILEKVRFEGEGRIEKSLSVQEALEHLKKMKIFNVFDLETTLLRLNDLSGHSFQSVLQKGENSPDGSLPITIQIIGKDDPAPVQAGLNNYGSLYVGPWQAQLSAPFSSVFSLFDQIDFQGLISVPLDELHYGQIAYTRPVGGLYGPRLTLSYNWAKTQASDSLAELDVLGLTQEVRLGLSYNPLRTRRKNLFILADLIAKNTRSKMLGAETYDDRIRYAKVGVSYDYLGKDGALTFMQFSVFKGLDALGARESGSFNLSRSNGQSDFSLVQMKASYQRPLGANFNLSAQVNGQYAFTPLLSSLEFGFGGHGYDESEITGDHGISGLIELQHRWQHGTSSDFHLEPYGFFQYGRVWNKNEENSGKSAASAGGGVRFDYQDQWKADFAIAVPLTTSAENAPDYTNSEGPRYLFSLTHRF